MYYIIYNFLAVMLFLREPGHQLSAAIFFERIVNNLSHIFETTVWRVKCTILVTEFAPHLTFASVGFCAAAIASFASLQGHSTALTYVPLAYSIRRVGSCNR